MEKPKKRYLRLARKRSR